MDLAYLMCNFEWKAYKNEVMNHNSLKFRASASDWTWTQILGITVVKPITSTFFLEIMLGFSIFVAYSWLFSGTTSIQATNRIHTQMQWRKLCNRRLSGFWVSGFSSTYYWHLKFRLLRAFLADNLSKSKSTFFFYYF